MPNKPRLTALEELSRIIAHVGEDIRMFQRADTKPRRGALSLAVLSDHGGAWRDYALEEHMATGTHTVFRYRAGDGSFEYHSHQPLPTDPFLFGVCLTVVGSRFRNEQMREIGSKAIAIPSKYKTLGDYGAAITAAVG